MIKLIIGSTYEVILMTMTKYVSLWVLFLVGINRVTRSNLIIVVSCSLIMSGITINVGAELLGDIIFILGYIFIYKFIKNQEDAGVSILLLAEMVTMANESLVAVMTLLVGKFHIFSNNGLGYLYIILMIIITSLLVGFFKRLSVRREFFSDYKYNSNFIYLTAIFLWIVRAIVVILGRQINKTGFLVLNGLFTWLTVVFLMLMGYLCLTLFNRLKNEELIKEQEQQEESFRLYLQEINNYYQEIANFRHDYKNLLLILGAEIDCTQNKRLKRYYRKITDYSNEQLSRAINNSNLEQISNLNSYSLRSVILSKMARANKDNLRVSLNIDKQIPAFRFHELEIARIVAILLDNAMEASKEQDREYIGIGIATYSENEIDIIIENEINPENSTVVNNLFKKGYTTKGEGHGRGLAIVKEICFSNGIGLNAEYEDGIMRIILEVSNKC